jgi:hypothetical protein
MNSQRAKSLSVWYFVFCIWNINIDLSQFVRILNTKHNILKTLVKSCFLTFYKDTNFILYKDFGLCYLIPLLEMKKMGIS